MVSFAPSASTALDYRPYLQHALDDLCNQLRGAGVSGSSLPALLEQLPASTAAADQLALQSIRSLDKRMGQWGVALTSEDFRPFNAAAAHIVTLAKTRTAPASLPDLERELQGQVDFTAAEYQRWGQLTALATGIESFLASQGAQGDGLVSKAASLGPRVSPALLRHVRELAQLRNTYTHTHACPTPEELRRVKDLDRYIRQALNTSA